jgi:hypothetical protein
LENLKGRGHAEDLDVDGNIKLDLLEVGCERVDWIDLAQDMGQWLAFVDTVMNLQVS